MVRSNNVVRLKDIGDGMRVANRKTEWILAGKPIQSVDDLSFFHRDGNGVNWWDVVPPKTSYWHVHQLLGRAYAFELLDLLNNPDAEYPDRILTCITGAMRKQSKMKNSWEGEAIQDGFFEVLSEYLGTGKVSR